MLMASGPPLSLGDPLRGRSGADRRRRATPIWGAFASPGRRRGFRRAGEGINCYVDRPSRRVVLWALLVLSLSALDAALTLFHIQAGGRELSPTMRLALHQGTTAFVAFKMAVTGLGIFILALHQNFALARYACRALLLTYLALTGYHFFLSALR
jgi:hypothetical protein